MIQGISDWLTDEILNPVPRMRTSTIICRRLKFKSTPTHGAQLPVNLNVNKRVMPKAYAVDL